ncbi:uncharacterized protein SAPINGB_P006106 [Magnusiomyces paraingens]|uniref:Uncharacterized protein n=1 Tax=Magnusiomyces paraingens TaxID=2606893 RepID=A0A5E8C8G4_9ASCO|nr:uncharacterized protein SAPINGB_P006106 [Saprochaete ingens]VVT58238.1 unnamed protein product [Saprochaete ingens]
MHTKLLSNCPSLEGQSPKKKDTRLGRVKLTWEEKGKSKPSVDPRYVWDGLHPMPPDYYSTENCYRRRYGITDEQLDSQDDERGRRKYQNEVWEEEEEEGEGEEEEEQQQQEQEAGPSGHNSREHLEEDVESEGMYVEVSSIPEQKPEDDSKIKRPSGLGQFISSVHESLKRTFGLGNRNSDMPEVSERPLDKRLYKSTLKTLYHTRSDSPGLDFIDDDSGSEVMTMADSTGHSRRQPSEFTSYKGIIPTEPLHKRWLKRNSNKDESKLTSPVSTSPSKKFKMNLVVMMAFVPPPSIPQKKPLQMPRARIEANKCKRCRKERKKCVCKLNLASFMDALGCSSMPGRTTRDLEQVPGLKDDYEVFSYDRYKWPHTDLSRSFDTVAILPSRWPNYYAWDPKINIISPEMFFMPRKFPWFRSHEVRRVLIHKTVLPYLEGLMRDIAAMRSKGTLTASIAAEKMGREYPNKSYGIVVDGEEILRVSEKETQNTSDVYRNTEFEEGIMKSKLLTVYTDYDLYYFDRNVFFQYSPQMEVIVQGDILSEEARDEINLQVNEETAFGHFTHRTQSHHEIGYIDQEEPRTFNMYHVLSKIGGSLSFAPETLYDMYSILNYATVNLTSLTVEVNVLKQAMMRLKPDMNNVGWGAITNDKYVPQRFGPTKAFDKLRTLILYPGKDTLVVDYQFMVQEINEGMPALQELQTTHLIDNIEPTVGTLDGLKRTFAKCKVLACFPKEVEFCKELRTDFPLMYLPAVTDLEVFVQDDETGADCQGLAEFVAAFLAHLNMPNLHTLVHRNLPFSWCSESIFESLSVRSNTQNKVTGMQQLEVMLREPEDYMHLLNLILQMPHLQHLNVISEANKELYKTGSYMQKISDACNVLSLFQDVGVLNDSILSDFREREVIESKPRFYLDNMDLKQLVLRNETHIKRAQVLDNSVFDSTEFIVKYMTKRFHGEKETGEVMARVIGSPLQTLMRSKDGHQWKNSEWGDIMYELSAIEALVMQLENMESLEYFALRTQCTAVASPRLFRLMVTHPRLRQVLVDEPTRRLWPEQKLEELTITPYVLFTEEGRTKRSSKVDGVEWLGPWSIADLPPWVRAVVGDQNDAIEWSKIEYLRKYRIAGLNYLATRAFGIECIRAYTRPQEVQGLVGRSTCGYSANMFVIDAEKVRRMKAPQLDEAIPECLVVKSKEKNNDDDDDDEKKKNKPIKEVALENEEGGSDWCEFTLERYMMQPMFLPRIDIAVDHEFDGKFKGWINKKTIQ